MTVSPSANSARSESLEQMKSNGADQINLHQNHGANVMPASIDAIGDPDEYLDRLGEDVMRIQHQVLSEILELQGNVEYLRRHGLNGRTDMESFRKCVPVVSYADMEPEILKVVNGEQTHSIFTVDPVSHFHSSSGTTGGKPKYIPSTERAEEFVFIPPILAALNRKLFPGMRKGKALTIAFAGKQKTTPSGLKFGAFSTSYYQSPRFRNRERGSDDDFCVPDEVILCDDIAQGIYCHLLCALYRKSEIVKVTSIFAATIVTAARVLQQHWREIAEDIRTGTVSNRITEPAMRGAVERMLLHPNPDLASTIERECSLENWEGIFPRLFPNARYVSGALTGSMLQYAPALQHFAGRLPLISPVYAASEGGILGINPDLMCRVEDIAYMLWPERNYYEFIPLGNEDGAAPLEACDLEVGKEYEILLTNSAGFYRYRSGDVIRVTSFRKTVPVFTFVRRISVILSVHADKTDEEELQAVVNKANLALLGSAMELSDYISTTDLSTLPGSNLNQDVLQKCANALDCGFNFIYQWGRSHGFIGPLELRAVREGTFHKIMEAAVGRGASPSQYKPPRCVNHPQAMKILKEGMVESFHSTFQPDLITHHS